MKSIGALFAIGVLSLVVQGALGRTIPPPWCPDLAWLVVVGIGLRWPHFLSGVVLAVALGYGMDLLSGSLMAPTTAPTAPPTTVPVSTEPPVTAAPTAPVAAPIRWSELSEIAPADVTLADVDQRLGIDPIDELADAPAEPEPAMAAVAGATLEHGVEIAPFDRFRS